MKSKIQFGTKEIEFIIEFRDKKTISISLINYISFIIYLQYKTNIFIHFNIKIRYYIKKISP